MVRIGTNYLTLEDPRSHSTMASIFRGMVLDVERFGSGFLKSAGVILASEIGDKTFFIAAVRACPLE